MEDPIHGSDLDFDNKDSGQHEHNDNGHGGSHLNQEVRRQGWTVRAAGHRLGRYSSPSVSMSPCSHLASLFVLGMVLFVCSILLFVVIHIAGCAGIAVLICCQRIVMLFFPIFSSFWWGAHTMHICFQHALVLLFCVSWLPVTSFVALKVTLRR